MNYVLIEPNMHLDFFLSETNGFCKTNPYSRCKMKFSSKDVAIVGFYNTTSVDKIYNMLVATRTKSCFILPLATETLFEKIYNEPIPEDIKAQIKLSNPSELVWFNSIAPNYQPLVGSDFVSHIDSIDTSAELFDINIILDDISLRQEEIERLNVELEKEKLLITIEE
jgi:hypothetical protein